MAVSLAGRAVRVTPPALAAIYGHLHNSPSFDAYRARHGIESADVLSVISDQAAERIADRLRDAIAGKVVVEIGAGVGLLGIHLGCFARRVFCIEANPYWSFMFAQNLAETKPRNVSFLMGSAEEFTDVIRGDVALFCSHTAVEHMMQVSAMFAPRVIDVYGEFFGRDATAAADMVVRLKAAGF